jgi:hypothetical protein
MISDGAWWCLRLLLQGIAYDFFYNFSFFSYTLLEHYVVTETIYN